MSECVCGAWGMPGELHGCIGGEWMRTFPTFMTALELRRPTFIDEVDAAADRIDSGGWPTRDAAGR